MQILVAAATALEIAPFIKKYPSADILVAGVGSPATIYHLTRRIRLIDYDLVIQAGIAGCFNTEVALGKVVVVHADTFADVGIRTNNGFSSLFDEGLADANHSPYTDGWLINPNRLLETLIYDKVIGITVNTLTDDKNITVQLATKYKAFLESMEGAALHYVCLQENVSFLQLRSISNYVGERNKSKWDMKLGIENLNNVLQEIYEQFLQGNKDQKPAKQILK